MYWFNFSFGHWRREKIKRTNNIAICGLVTMTFQLKTLLNQRPRQGCIFCKEASGICKTKGKMWGKSLKTVKTNKNYREIRLTCLFSWHCLMAVAGILMICRQDKKPFSIVNDQASSATQIMVTLLLQYSGPLTYCIEDRILQLRCSANWTDLQDKLYCRMIFGLDKRSSRPWAWPRTLFSYYILQKIPFIPREPQNKES